MGKIQSAGGRLEKRIHRVTARLILAKEVRVCVAGENKMLQKTVCVHGVLWGVKVLTLLGLSVQE